MKERIHLTKKQILILIVSVGLLILVLLIPTKKEEKEENNFQASVVENQSASLDTFIKDEEKRLKAVVERISGAGDVYVMITVKSSSEQIIEKDITKSEEKITETDSNGGYRNSNSINTSEASLYNERTGDPYVIKEIQPQIEGIVVAASGAGEMEVVREITDTVAVLYNLPVHKIKVVKME